ncbi:unnamed protein product [Kuraishia capsulata CBS 1993]|uniref:Zn(2)-C6 fungal-type domain-containing protein n=1 Tax=Kuraishia capsulata CBS 1993 TaxID=1382522 RepID=W6MR32_9ASCO|nr:uncharacterized protein KUCA_T00004798001 [Kuraishia capsulata CBS 1993]CDK28813.1 unnamed protein product [Kuraishia capsulata CBS 1993]
MPEHETTDLPDKERLLFPVSCVTCRRRKIKCDRVLPCLSCVKRGEDCRYPEKYRSIEISQFVPQLRDVEENLSGGSENQSLLHDIVRLKEDNHVLLTELKRVNRNRALSALGISPANSRKRDRDQEKNMATCPAKEMSYPMTDEDFSLSRINQYFVGGQSKFLVTELVLAKDSYNLERFIKMGDVPVSFGLTKMVIDDDKANFHLTKTLCDTFFKSRSYYNNFISKSYINGYLERYPASLKDPDSHDTIMLITMMCLSVVRFLHDTNPLLTPYKVDFHTLRQQLYTKFFFLKTITKPFNVYRRQALILACEDYYFQTETEMAFALLYEIAGSFNRQLIDERTSLLMEQFNMPGMGSHEKVKVVREDLEVASWLAATSLANVVSAAFVRSTANLFPASPLCKYADIRIAYNLGIGELLKATVQVLMDVAGVSSAHNKESIMELQDAWTQELTIYKDLLGGNVEKRKEVLKALQKMNATDLDGSSSDDSVPDAGLRSYEDIGNTENLLIDSDLELLSDLLMGYVGKGLLSETYMLRCPNGLDDTLESIIKALNIMADLLRLLEEKKKKCLKSAFPFAHQSVTKVVNMVYTILHLDYDFIYPSHLKIALIRQKLLVIADRYSIYWQINFGNITSDISFMMLKYEQRLKNSLDIDCTPSTEDSDFKSTSQSVSGSGLTPQSYLGHDYASFAGDSPKHMTNILGDLEVSLSLMPPLPNSEQWMMAASGTPGNGTSPAFS